jgi:Zinc-binding dehydrogenase
VVGSVVRAVGEERKSLVSRQRGRLAGSSGRGLGPRDGGLLARVPVNPPAHSPRRAHDGTQPGTPRHSAAKACQEQLSAALWRCSCVLAPSGACISVDDGTPKLRREDLVSLAELAATGAIRLVIDRTYALADIVDAHRYVDIEHKRGNVILTVP